MNQQSGIGATGVLLIVFVVLKLTGNVTWSWVWVLAPAWMTTGLMLTVLGVAMVLDAFAARGRQKRAGLR